jgi:hypothetical protein
MKNNKNTVWLITILTLVLGCKNLDKTADSIPDSKASKQESIKQNPAHPKNTPNDIYSVAAIETCTCMEPMLQKAKHLKELETNKQFTEMKKIASEMEAIRPQIQKCSDEIRKKYVKISGKEDEIRVKNALLTQCPDMVVFSKLSKMTNN